MESRNQQEEFPAFPPPRAPAGPSGQRELNLPDVRRRKVLIGYPDSLAIRTIRLTLEGMRNILCDSSPCAERAFERAMQYNYDLFILALGFDDISGELLYSLIDKAYRLGEGDRVAAPGVIFIQDKAGARPASLHGDHRVKGLLCWPFGMEELLESVDKAMPGTAVGRAIRPTS